MMPIIRPLPRNPSAQTEYEKECALYERLKVDLQSRKPSRRAQLVLRLRRLIAQAARRPIPARPRSPVR